jgi:hypothetical protein
LYSGFNDTASLSLSDSELQSNVARGGPGGDGGDGGHGLGGGLTVQSTSSGTVENSVVWQNEANSGEEGDGGSAGQGVGGGVYNLGALAIDVLSAITRNHASTSNDDIYT